MQLTLKDLEKFVKECKENKLSLTTPVYIGDDDELNGVHCAWYIQSFTKDDEEGLSDLVIERSGNNEPKDINILIS